jgi:hypothetical protein
MAFVDLEGDKLVLKTVIAGPPHSGKTTRLKQIGKDPRGLFHVFGSKTRGFTTMARLWLESEESRRPVLIEIYEWGRRQRESLGRHREHLRFPSQGGRQEQDPKAARNAHLGPTR